MVYQQDEECNKASVGSILDTLEAACISSKRAFTNGAPVWNSCTDKFASITILKCKYTIETNPQLMWTQYNII